MPGISDPGFRLISLAIRITYGGADSGRLGVSGLRWWPVGSPPIPSGLADFFPPKRGERWAALETIKTSPRTPGFYEAPHRIVEALADVVEALGKGSACGNRARG